MKRKRNQISVKYDYSPITPFSSVANMGSVASALVLPSGSAHLFNPLVRPRFSLHDVMAIKGGRMPLIKIVPEVLVPAGVNDFHFSGMIRSPCCVYSLLKFHWTSLLLCYVFMGDTGK